MDEEIVFVLGFIVLLVGFFVGGTAFTVNHLTFPGEIASIETLRSSVQDKHINEKDHIFSAVVECNRNISSTKKYRKIWWSKLFLPKGWDSVEPIIIQKDIK